MLGVQGFEQGGIFIVPHLLWHGASVFPVSSEGPPHSVASYDTQGDAEDLFYPGSNKKKILKKSEEKSAHKWLIVSKTNRNSKLKKKIKIDTYIRNRK
jgi:hypothetical protein